MAVGAFVLTVMLGLGGGAASALWQQSATATMTVTASGAWPAQGFTCVKADSADKFVNLTYDLAQPPTSLSLSAKLANGSYGTSMVQSTNAAAGTIALKADSSVFSQTSGMASVTVRITPTYGSTAGSPAELTFKFDTGTGNNKIYCS